MLSVGDEVDRYAIEAVIGEGGMARVYRVRHTKLDATYALKVLTITSTGLQERLVAEGKAQAKLLHPNVLRVIDVVDAGGAPGLVMDFIDGPDLHEWIEAEPPGVAAALDVFRGIAAGVQAAHEAGLIHRDLKPANVLLETDAGGRRIPKVNDFGLVKALVGDKLHSSSTRSGMPMGTPSYMPPEQIRDASTVDERADVFALGCILYELVAHERAFDGTDPIDIFDKVRACDHAPFPEGMPEHVRRTVTACLAPERDARPASIAAVLELLGGSTASLPSEGSRGRAAAVGAEIDRVVGEVGQHLPDEVKRDPKIWMAGVAIGVGGLGVALVVFLLSMTMLTAMTTPTCEAPATGWVQLAQGGLPRDRADWLARGDAVLHDAVDGSAICTLPAGTRARVAAVAEPLDPGDPWVQLDADGMKLTAAGSVAPDEPPVCWGAVEGWARATSLFTRPKRGATTWSVKPSQDLLEDRPTEANEWSSDHPAVCRLPAGATVTLDGDWEHVQGLGTWIPVREVR